MITSSQQLTPRFTDIAAIAADHEPRAVADSLRRLTPSCQDEQEVRGQIDRAVGRALIDHSFAARLLAEPSLAVDKEACDQMQYPALRKIRADLLDDFARQVFDQFWGPAHHLANPHNTEPRRAIEA